MDRTEHVLDSLFLDLYLLDAETINTAIENVKAAFYKIRKILSEADLEFTLDNPHKSDCFSYWWEKTEITLDLFIYGERDDDNGDHHLYIALSLTDTTDETNEFIGVVYYPLEEGWQCWIPQIEDPVVKDTLQTIPDLNFIPQVHEIGSKAVIDENTALEIIRKLIEYWQGQE